MAGPKLGVPRRMAGTRLEYCTEWLAQGLLFAPDGWCKAWNIAPNGWRETNIALDGGARLILRSMVARG